MKLATFRLGKSRSYGALADGGIVDLGLRHGHLWPDVLAVLQDGALDRLRDLAAGVGPDHSLADIALQPPVPSPGRILCVGLNYRSHIEETGRQLPDHPTLFTRFPDSHVGHGEAIVRPRLSSQHDFEGELAVVIGRPGRHIRREVALDHVAGYSCYNDGSIRDYQAHTSQFTAGKNFWRSGAFGPWLATRDEIPDPGDLQLQTRLNGEVMQMAPTSDLLFDVPHLIEYISAIFPLRPGDVISTGTTGGVGKARNPPVFLKAGDRIEVEISRIGTLSNVVEDEPPAA